MPLSVPVFVATRPVWGPDPPPDPPAIRPLLGTSCATWPPPRSVEAAKGMTIKSFDSFFMLALPTGWSVVTGKTVDVQLWLPATSLC